MGNRWRPKWHGELVEIEHVVVCVRPNKENPLFWYNYDCEVDGGRYQATPKAQIPALEVKPKGRPSFLISNQNGKGLNKVRKGGWPDTAHASFDNDDIEKIIRRGERGFFEVLSFCEKDYAEREASRMEWQKKNFPEEFEKSEALRQMIRQGALYKS